MKRRSSVLTTLVAMAGERMAESLASWEENSQVRVRARARARARARVRVRARARARVRVRVSNTDGSVLVALG